jgi:hypothetical protein
MADYQMTWHRLCENRRDAMRLLAAAGFDRSEIAEFDAVNRAQVVALGVLAGIGCFTRGKGPEPWIWHKDDPGDPFEFLKSLSAEEKMTLRVDANGSFDEFITEQQS